MLNTKTYCKFSTKNSCYRQAQNKHILPLHSSPHSFFKRKKYSPQTHIYVKKKKNFLICPIAGILALRREPRKKRRKVYMLSKAPHSFFNRRTSVNFCHPQNLKIFLLRQNPKIFAIRAARKNFFIAINLGISLHCAQFGGNPIFLPPLHKKIFAEFK